MFPSILTAQSLVLFILGVGAFLTQMFALIDGIRWPASAYSAAGKMTKQRWLIILGIAAAIGFVSFNTNATGFLNIIAFVAAAVYLADVRPALQQVSGRGRGRSSGPQGPW
ncbi:MAG: DUF2516 family protein [Actinomycetota bacterium]